MATSPTLHKPSAQMRSRRADARQLPSIGNETLSLGRPLHSAAGARRRSPSRSGNFGCPLGQPQQSNPLLSLVLAVDGVDVATLLVELRHNQAPHATAALRRLAPGYRGRTLSFSENHFTVSGGGPVTEVAPSDGASAAGLGHWARGVVSLSPEGGLALLLSPCELPGHRPVGQVVKGYLGLARVEAAAKIGSDRGQKVDLTLAEATAIRGLPGEALPPPMRRQPPAAATKRPLKLLHFNDVYEVEAREREPVGGVSRFVAKLNSFRGEGRAEPCVVFSGDVFAPSLMSTVTKGKHMVKYLNMMGITAACIGNHDFDFGTENLEKLIGESNFPWLLSNVVSKHDGQQLAHGRRTLIVEHEGWKLGFMGLIEQEWLATLATIEPDEVVYTDFVEAAHELAAELKGAGCDLVIACTHSRVPNDTRLAQECPELDLILGGHDHDAWRTVVGGVPVIKSGTDFRELTELTITPPAINAGTQKCTVEWNVIEITGDLAEDAEAARLVAEDGKELSGSMDKIIGSIGVPLDTRFAKIRTEETNASNWIADIIRDGTAAEVTILNSGTLRADELIPVGLYRMRDLVKLLPMLDELCVLSLTGAQLHAALENGVSQYPKLEGRWPCVSGVSFEFDSTKPGGSRIEPGCILVNGEPLDEEKEYSVATKAYLASGKDGYDVFKAGRMIMDGECAPLIPNLVRNHFSFLATLNKMSSKKPAVLQRAIQRFKVGLDPADTQAGDTQEQDVPYKVQPQIEGRIRQLSQ